MWTSARPLFTAELMEIGDNSECISMMHTARLAECILVGAATQFHETLDFVARHCKFSSKLQSNHELMVRLS
jgi:hypothetical protein